ncbi:MULTISPECIES: TraB/VirB10 family protein [Cysteiniphilum]|uniref:TraB/VirB10 family protein n=1 Tax=Cysteiniphilum TaxID=2056696 RepID=UPI00178154FB|nr:MULTISPECIES: TraB/VirB10 family protein [Cysteiniphilum]
MFFKRFNLWRKLFADKAKPNSREVGESKESKESEVKQENEYSKETLNTTAHDAVDQDTFNPNNDRVKQIATSVLIVAVIGLAVWVFMSLFASSPKSGKSKKLSNQSSSELSNFAKVKDATFTEEDNKSALTDQQRQIDEFKRLLAKQDKTLETLQDKLGKQDDALKKERERTQKLIKTQHEQTKALIASSEKATQSNKKAQDDAKAVSNQPIGQPLSGGNQFALGINHGVQGGFEQTPVYPTVSFSARKKPVEIEKYKRTHKNYVPTGSFCKAIVLGGADAQAGVDAQSDSSPMVFKLTDNCYLPNGKRGSLKGAFITASVYGRISSERGMVRLESLSYIRQDGSILDISVEGTAFDVGGKNGIRGIPVMRNDKVIMSAGLSGILSGFGDSAQAYSQTQSVSPLGSTTTIDASKILPNALGAGASTAFGEISKYYIELAKQYSPVIQLNAGAEVDIVFLKGFPLLDEKKIKQYEDRIDRERRIAKDKNNKNNPSQLQDVEMLQNMQNMQNMQTASMNQKAYYNPLMAQIPKPTNLTNQAVNEDADGLPLGQSR